MGFLADAAGLFRTGGDGGFRFGESFQGKLTQWKAGVGSPSDKMYSEDGEFFPKLRALEKTVGPIPFGIDKTAQSSTLSKLAQRNSGGTMSETMAKIPVWVKVGGGLLLAFLAFKFFTRKKRR
jgi:hypothetical protein